MKKWPQIYLSFGMQVSEINGPDPGPSPDVENAADFGVRFARRGEAQFAIESVDEDLMLLIYSSKSGNRSIRACAASIQSASEKRAHT